MVHILKYRENFMRKFKLVILMLLLFCLSSSLAFASELKTIDRKTKVNLVWQPTFIKTADNFALLPPIK